MRLLASRLEESILPRFYVYVILLLNYTLYRFENIMIYNTKYAVWTFAVNPNLNIAVLWINNLEEEPRNVQFDSQMPSQSITPLLLYNITTVILLISIYD